MEGDHSVTLISKEGQEFSVSVQAARMSGLVGEALEDQDDDDDNVQSIPLPNVKSSILGKVIDYCNHYQVEPMTDIQTPLSSSKLEDLVQPWYTEFCRIEQVMLFELVTAANFMNIKPLLDLTCLAVSISIKGKSEEELRRIFNISPNFSPEEEAQVKRENAWANQPENNNGPAAE